MSWLSRRCVAVLGAAALACPAQITRINVTNEAQRDHVKRFGINLGNQTYYDSGQMMRNLIFRNPGFQGETWSVILRCKAFTRTGCVDANPYTVWPAGFMDGAAFEVLSGRSAGARGKVQHSSAAAPPRGFAVTFPALNNSPADGDFLAIHLERSGDITSGWWPGAKNGATFSPETHDLPPGFWGKRVIRVQAAGAGQEADLTSYFETLDGHSFVRLKGTYRLSFQAKPLSPSAAVGVYISRLDTVHGNRQFLDKQVSLLPGWHTYNIPVKTDERDDAVGGIPVTLRVHGATALLAGVSFTPAVSPRNPTAFRDPVVQALRDLQPGILRYMDGGASFGTSLDNWLMPAEARMPSGATTQGARAEDIGIGLHEFLQLCETVGAEPWVALPPAITPEEAAALVEYLSGDAGTKYGGVRSVRGHRAPWTQVFPTIHLELGNEQWNNRSFAGSTIHDATAYGRRAATIFSAMRSVRGFTADRYDLVAGSWFAVPWWTEQELKALNGAANSLAVAPYLFSEFNSAPGMEAVFGPMFAQPEQYDSTPAGTMTQQAAAVARLSPRTRLSVYEVNLGTAVGAQGITQTAIDRTVPSVGSGIAVADHMLLMLRDLGITDQCLYSLAGFGNGFTSDGGGPRRTIPLWGAVVDMGGMTDRRRPTFLALQAVNSGLLPTMLKARISGTNPVWNQAPSTNDKIALPGAHMLQVFAFSGGRQRSLIVLNLSRSAALPVAFEGVNAPAGNVEQTVLTSTHIEDNNENAEQVKAEHTSLPHFDAHATRSLPPFSLTVYRWTTP